MGFNVNEVNKILSEYQPGFKQVEGTTSDKICYCLNKFTGLMGNGCCYFEVGSYKGATLIGATLGRNVKAYACDNFSMQLGNSDWPSEFRKNSQVVKNLTFFECNFETLDLDLIKEPIGVYFYDGAHDLASQYNGIMKVVNKLASNSLIVVDDYNWKDVQDGTNKAITELISKGVRLDTIVRKTERINDPDPAGFHNGVIFIIFKKPDSLSL